MSQDCLICSKHRARLGPILYEGQGAILAHYPCSVETPKVYKGHLFVEAKRHVPTFAELEPAEAAEMGTLIAQGSKLVREYLAAEHIYILTIGHLVNHLHVHIIPRYVGTPKEYWGGFKLWEWPEAPMLSDAEVEPLAEMLRRAAISAS